MSLHSRFPLAALTLSPSSPPNHSPPPAGLHTEAFQLAEAAFSGTQLSRALERTLASLTAACVKQQLACGRAVGAAGAAEGGADDMETEEATAGGGSAGSDSGGGGVADWRRLKEWLRRCACDLKGCFWCKCCCFILPPSCSQLNPPSPKHPTLLQARGR